MTPGAWERLSEEGAVAFRAPPFLKRLGGFLDLHHLELKTDFFFAVLPGQEVIDVPFVLERDRLYDARFHRRVVVASGQGDQQRGSDRSDGKKPTAGHRGSE
jgi:hypothetical protein